MSIVSFFLCYSVAHFHTFITDHCRKKRAESNSQNLPNKQSQQAIKVLYQLTLVAEESVVKKNKNLVENLLDTQIENAIIEETKGKCLA